MSDDTRDSFPVVEVGDRISLKWPDVDDIYEADVVKITKSKEIKNSSKFIYHLKLLNITASEAPNDAILRKTRLLHLDWKLLRRELTLQDVSYRKRKRKEPKPYKYIVAPMVGGSELSFRLLCRRYGATLAYTPMIHSDRFAVDEAYRLEMFQSCAGRTFRGQ